MYENDYILRMIRQATEVIAKLILNKEIKSYDLCHEITDTALKENFGLSKELLLKLPATYIKELIGGDGNSQAIFFLAQLFFHEGEVFEKEGFKIQGDLYYRKSLELLSVIDDADDELNEYIAHLRASVRSK